MGSVKTGQNAGAQATEIAHVKVLKRQILFAEILIINPLRPNNDESQTSHCNIKGLSVSEVMRTENMITQVQFY